MNTFPSAGRFASYRARPAGRGASQSRHPTVRQSVRATLPSESVQKSLTATAASAAHKIPSASRRSSQPGGRAGTAAFAAIFSIAKWCITIEIYHTWSNFVLLHPSQFRRMSLRRPSSPPSSSVSIWPPRCARCATCRRSSSGRGGITIESRRARRRGGRRRGRRRWRARRRCRGPWGSCSRWSCR